MPRKRITLKVRSEAYDALMELSRTYGLNPQKVVEKLLISHQKSIRDDELCHKEFFEHSIVYITELPFCFPYECEMFELKVKGQRRAKIYIERVPKRHVYGKLPFKTLTTIVIELDKDEQKNVAQDVSKARRIGEKHINTAFKLLKNLIVGFRRITGIYYNIGVVEPPANLEEFKKRVKIIVIINNKTVNSYWFMPVKVDSIIIVGKHLEREVYSAILSYMIKGLPRAFSDALSSSWEYLDAAIISHYREQWNLAVLQSVIAMESTLSNIVFNKPFKNYFMKRYKSEDELRKKYKSAQNLPNKISKFLFPLLKFLGLNNIIRELKEIMPDIAELYNLRSDIVHEGNEGNEKDAKRAIESAKRLLRLTSSMIESSLCRA